jgi:hypothetical protein
MAKRKSQPNRKALTESFRAKALVNTKNTLVGTRYIHPEVAERQARAALLLKNIKEQLPELEKLLAASNDHWVMEDGVYRFYHQSFKVYDRLQPITLEITKALQKLLLSSSTTLPLRQMMMGKPSFRFSA